MKKNANTTPKTRNSTIEIERKIVLYLARAPIFYFFDDISKSRTIEALFVFI